MILYLAVQSLWIRAPFRIILKDFEKGGHSGNKLSCAAAYFYDAGDRAGK